MASWKHGAYGIGRKLNYFRSAFSRISVCECRSVSSCRFSPQASRIQVQFLQLIVCYRIIGRLSSSLQIISTVLCLPLTAYILVDSRPQRASFRDVAVGKYLDIKYGVHKCCSRLACWITSAHSPIHVYRLSDVYLYKKGNVCKIYCYFTWKVGFFWMLVKI